MKIANILFLLSYIILSYFINKSYYTFSVRNNINIYDGVGLIDFKSKEKHHWTMTMFAQRIKILSTTRRWPTLAADRNTRIIKYYVPNGSENDAIL